MPSDLQSIADPRLILLCWAAGLSLVAGIISFARIVGPGFTWLTAGTAALVGLPGALAADGWWARAGLVLALVGILRARNRPFAGLALMLAGLAYVTQAAILGGWIPAATATLALGGVSGEMALGHWYLVDPRLPRGALRDLAVVGIAGLVAESAMTVYLDVGFTGGSIGYWVLVITSVVLMAAVIAAIRYPAYSGVMAATGLSYLALLTTLGTVFVGRAIVAGLGPFRFG
ncbi:MAG TPA: hypothetical protein VFP42_12085 [Acidimicrobiia bacterium]|nr:hypothetical protein [Acidimicrobiia bacterium]